MVRVEEVIQRALIEAELFDELIKSWKNVIVRFRDGSELEAMTDGIVLVFSGVLDDDKIREIVNGEVEITVAKKERDGRG